MMTSDHVWFIEPSFLESFQGANSLPLSDTVVLVTVAVTLIGGSQVSYTDESQWPALCQTGTRQSPIDLPPLNKTKVAEYDKLNFTNYETPVDETIVNAGNEVVLHVRKPGTCVLSGGGLPGVYYLATMHFHWGAEHTMQGKRLPLELHLVHYAKKYSGVTEASQHPQGLAVVGVLFKESADKNTKLDPLLAALTQVDNTPKVPYPMSIAPAQLLPGDVTMYYRYEGSLTTPGCNETVVWTVMSAPVPISKKQLTSFLSLRVKNHTVGDNFRSIQNLNGRVITSPQPRTSGVVRISAETSLLLLAIGMLTLAL